MDIVPNFAIDVNAWQAPFRYFYWMIKTKAASRRQIVVRAVVHLGQAAVSEANSTLLDTGYNGCFHTYTSLR